MLFQEMDYPDTASAPVRREAKPRAGLYILVVLAAMVGAFAYHMRDAGIFACQATDYADDHYLGYCNGTAYADYDHGAVWFGLEPGGARGGGGGRRALPRQQPPAVRLLRPGDRRSGSPTRARSYYLLGFSDNETFKFTGPLLEEPAAEGAGLRHQRRQVLLRAGIAAGGGDPARSRRARALRGQAGLAGAAPADLRGAAAASAATRSPSTATGRPASGCSTARNGLKGAARGGQVRQAGLRQGQSRSWWRRSPPTPEAFIAGLGVPPACVILTYVPSPENNRLLANAIAAAVGQPLIAPHGEGLQHPRRLASRPRQRRDVQHRLLRAGRAAAEAVPVRRADERRRRAAPSDELAAAAAGLPRASRRRRGGRGGAAGGAGGAGRHPALVPGDAAARRGAAPRPGGARAGAAGAARQRHRRSPAAGDAGRRPAPRPAHRRPCRQLRPVPPGAARSRRPARPSRPDTVLLGLAARDFLGAVPLDAPAEAADAAVAAAVADLGALWARAQGARRPGRPAGVPRRGAAALRRARRGGARRAGAAGAAAERRGSPTRPRPRGCCCSTSPAPPPATGSTPGSTRCAGCRPRWRSPRRRGRPTASWWRGSSPPPAAGRGSAWCSTSTTRSGAASSATTGSTASCSARAAASARRTWRCRPMPGG